MPVFVDTDAGPINLDHVARVTANQAAHKDVSSYSFRGTDGSMLGSFKTVADFDLVELTAPVVSAAAGTIAVLVTVIPEARGARPTPGDVWIERVPIVAWRVCRGGAQPVLIEQPCGNETVLIEMPGGRLLAPGDCTHSDLDAAKCTILADHQREWDRDHATASVS